MNKDDIIRMARDAGSIDSEEVIETVFAAFAAAERDRMCEQFNIPKELAHEKAKGNETN